MSVPIHAFDTVPIRADLRANRDSGDVILDADGKFIVLSLSSPIVTLVTSLYRWLNFGDNYMLLVTKFKNRR